LVAKELFSRVQTALADLMLEVDGKKTVEVHFNTHIYSSVNSLSDVDDVLAEIRSILRQVS
jgi:hypothetical protein